MAYLEIIKCGKKQYFYLTKNIRLSLNKWKKIRIYIGDKKPTKIEISKYAKKIEEKIKSSGLTKIKSKFAYLNENDVEVLQDLKESYKDWLKNTPESIKRKLDDDFVIRFTYSSNAIEGNKLTLRQTALILKDKVMPLGVEAEDYNEAINGKECLDYLKNHKGDFNKKLLLTVNKILTKNTRVIYGGRIRFFDVRIEGSKHTPPKSQELKKHILNMFKWYSSNKNKLHPFELAALLHYKLAWIHPFEDGNGRTARTIMNFILLKKGYPMFFIPYEKREDYYTSLETADKGEYKKYIKKMLDIILDQIRIYGHKNKKR